MKAAREVAFNVCGPHSTIASFLLVFRIVADACRVGNLRLFRGRDVRFRAMASGSRRTALTVRRPSLLSLVAGAERQIHVDSAVVLAEGEIAVHSERHLEDSAGQRNQLKSAPFLMPTRARLLGVELGDSLAQCAALRS